MKWTVIILSCLIGFLAQSQEINIGKVENKIVLGDLAGNRDLAFGVRNVLEEVVQDAGYDLNPNSNSEITVEILFFDVQKNSLLRILHRHLWLPAIIVSDEIAPRRRLVSVSSTPHWPTLGIDALVVVGCCSPLETCVGERSSTLAHSRCW